MLRSQRLSDCELHTPNNAGANAFAADYRRFLIDAGHAKLSDSSGTNNAPAYALAVWPGAIRFLDVDGGILAPERYVAIGSGHDIAYGALHLAYTLRFTARAAVTAALQASVAHDLWTGGPFDVWVEDDAPNRIVNAAELDEEIRIFSEEERKRAELSRMEPDEEEP